MSSNRRIIRCSPVDRLSKLPDSLLIHILSFLGVKEASRTSLLSRRFEFLWAELPTLKFRETTGDCEEMLKFVSWVTRTLDLRTANQLDGFEVRLKRCRHINYFIDSWLKYAVKNNVKNISVLLIEYGAHYRAPGLIYSCSSLKTLRVQGLAMPSVVSKIEWKFLTELSIKNSRLDQLFIDGVMENCPVLCVLELDGSWGYDRLLVASPSLYKLTAVYPDVVDGHSQPFVEISAQYLYTLVISVNVSGRRFRLRDMLSLVSADIDLSDVEEMGDEVMSDVEELFENLRHTHELCVGRECFKAVSIMAVKGWQLPQSRRKHLIVTSPDDNELSIYGIISLLDSSPFLETLVIEAYDTNLERYPDAKDDLDGDLLHLKTITMKNFAHRLGEHMLTLAEILLKRATALEEMVIVTNVEDSIDFGRIARTLLAYPRSSKTAVVLLY